MRITPDYLAGLPQPIIEIFYGVEDYIITDIARRIRKMGEATSTAEMQRIALEAMGIGVDDINTMLAAALDTTEHEVEQIFSGAVRDAAIQPGWAQRIGNAAAATTNDLRNMTRTAGYVMNNGQFSMWTDAYRQTISTAQFEILSGAVDYNTAIRNALKPFTSQGLTTVGYESGRKVSIEAAARQSIMQGARDTIQQIWREDADRMGMDGWELSAHLYCAPDHEPYQGRQYSREEYEQLNNNLKRPIGTLNCRHVAFPVILGVSEPAYSEAELSEMARKNAEGITLDGKHYTGYEATQLQRRMERSIRKTKRELIGFDKSGLKDDFTSSSIRLRRQRDIYSDFCKQVGLTPRSDLTQVSGYGRRMSGKALYAERKELEKYSQYHYNKDGTIVVTDDWKSKVHPRIPVEFKPYAVMDTVSRSGKQNDRTYYDANARMVKQINSSHHGNPARHQFGNNGEHAHDVTWENEKVVDRPMRELTDAERKENGDII